MLADIVGHVIGIDPDRDRITASLVEASTGGELATAAFETTRGGYERLVAWAERHTSRESRAWAVEGSGSYGSGACAHLGAAGEQVIEFSHPRTAATSDGAKTDALDARRAAREVLGRPDLAVPRARGRREALRALETTRRGAQRRAPRRSTNSKPSSSARPWTCATNSAASPPPPRSPNARRCACRRRPSTSSQPPNRPAQPRAADQDPHRRGRRAANEHPRARRSRRPPPARPARRRTRHRRANLHRLVTPRPRPQRSSLRPPRRRRPTRSILRTKHPPPPQPPRRPPTQPSPAHHRRHPQPLLPPHPGLHHQTNRRRQNPPRSPTLPQTLRRPPDLPPPPTPQNQHLTNIEASFPRRAEFWAPTPGSGRLVHPQRQERRRAAGRLRHIRSGSQQAI